MAEAPLRIAVVGAGPAGLALALHAARVLPRACIAVFDARGAEHDVSADPRTLALSIGSVQLLRRLGAWPGDAAEPIVEVQVSQAPPAPPAATVHLRAGEMAVPMLGAVVAYGPLVAALQAAWQATVADDPRRHSLRLGAAVQALKPLPSGVEVDAGIAEAFDLAVVAEGGVFADQARKAVAHDYRQTAWIGSVTLAEAPAGTAFEHFTRQGPLALLPLRGPNANGRRARVVPEGAPGDASSGGPRGGPMGAPPAPASTLRRAALVWCVDATQDPVAPLAEAQRLALLNALLPAAAGRIVEMSALKSFALGLNAERTLVDRRTVRIGNAAQTLHPVAGQGLNLGLRDAFALVEGLRRHGDVDAALRRIEWSRAPDRWATIATTDFLARSFTWGWPGLGLARGAALAALQAVPPLKAVLARRMMFGTR